MAERSYDRIADLPLQVDACRLHRSERQVAGGWARVTTEVRLTGAGEEGVGEDVTYEVADQDLFQTQGAPSGLEGRWTLALLSEHVDGIDLFPRPPAQEASRWYRRWAFESAALDLALRQADLSLAAALGRDAAEVRFVVSPGLGVPPSVEPLRQLGEVHGDLRFKLDPGSGWSDEFLRRLAARGSVEILDLKGAYRGTPVDQPADARVYRRVFEWFPDAWVEDPVWSPATEAILRPHRERVTWDVPIHSVADIEALPFPPRMLNFKPSRFGTLRALLDAYDHCRARGIRMYGGGQFELGPGRGQIQLLASLFHGDAPNDVAPVDYHQVPPGPGAPPSPLPPPPDAPGFRWDRARRPG